MSNINKQAILLSLPSKIRGFSVKNEDDTYSVFVNSKLSHNAQQEAIMHELLHIEKEDFNKDIVDIIESEAHELKGE